MASNVTTIECTHTNHHAAKSTRAAYAKDVRLFQQRGGSLPCSSDEVREYARMLVPRLRPTTLYRRLMAIRDWHRNSGHPDPVPSDVLLDLRRRHRVQRAGATCGARHPVQGIDELVLIKAVCRFGSTPRDQRDRAVLLLMLGSGKKRAALAALDRADVTMHADRMVVRFTLSERAADRTRSCDEVVFRARGDSLCAVSALKAWIRTLDRSAEQPRGALFRRLNRAGDPTSHRLDGAYVTHIVKQRLSPSGPPLRSISAFARLHNVTTSGAGND